jgi:hypothetical protein
MVACAAAAEIIGEVTEQELLLGWGRRARGGRR